MTSYRQAAQAFKRGRRGSADGNPGGGSGTVDAGQSTCTATTPVNTGNLSTVTITAKGSGGSPVPNVSVTISVSGSNNTINQPGANTDANGKATATFASTTAETKTVTATAGGVVITQQATVVVSTGTTALLTEDFSTYSSTANMLSDPRGIYSVAEDVETAQMVLDQSVGYSTAGLTQSMRYDFPDRTGTGGSGNTGRCSDYTIGRNINLPSHITGQMWVEWITKFSSGWTTIAPGGWGCTTAPAYKAFFGRTDVSRFQMVPGIFGTEYTLGYPGNEEPSDDPMTWTMFDGSWHVHRIWYGQGAGTGGTVMLADGSLIKSLTGKTPTSSYIYGLALGRNMNQGPAMLSSIWWGRITVYSSDPGWGIP